MMTLLVLPWQRTREPVPEHPLLFASRFDAAGLRPAWHLFTRGLALRQAVLRSPGALGVALRAHPFRGHYYTLSMWRDEESLLAFAHSPAHQEAVRRIAELGPVRGVLVSRPVGRRSRPSWREIMRWLATTEPGHYRRQAEAGDRESPVPARLE
jgi:heme-degrading monooxygenase HmoA